MQLKFITALFTFLLFPGMARAASITVTEHSDSFNMGNCSLRDAVQSVNTKDDFGGCNFTGSFGSNDTINLEAGTYTLSLGSSDENNNADGDIDITKPVLIQGAGAESTNVTGGFPSGEEDRIFDVCNNLGCDSNLTDTTVQISGLAISNGGSLSFIEGGGIRASQPFQAQSPVQLILQNCQVRDNSVTLNGGVGGGILNDGAEILIERCSVTGNQAFRAGGIQNPNGFMAINESTIDDNEAAFFGGGIEVGNSALLLYNSTVSNNRALFQGDPQFNTFGGGIFVNSVCNSSTLIVNSTISGNQAQSLGGGIFAGACIDDTGVNTDVGGAGFGPPPGVFLFNDTITLNEVLEANGQGGGIFFNPLTPPALTLGEVGATGGPGIFAVGMSNTILAQNQADLGPDCFSEVDSGHFNLIGDTTDCTIQFSDATDIINPNPGLGPLQDNGGPTQTHGLLVNSPAIDMGNNLQGVGCQAPDFDELVNNNVLQFSVLDRDQRDFPRPIAVLDPNVPVCDIGAFEFQVFDFAVTKDDGLGGESISVGNNFDYTITVTNNGPGAATAVTLGDPLPSGMEFVSVTPSQGTCTGGTTINCDLGDLDVGESATVTVTVTATTAGSFTNIVTLTLSNPFQQQLTETAQVTTTVVGTGGLLLFSAGCELQRGAMQVSPQVWAPAIMIGGIVAFQLILRRRHSSSKRSPATVAPW